MASDEIPARSEEVMSSAETASGRLRASTSRALFCRSSKGSEVEASITDCTPSRATPTRQSRAASTAMVTASSSQLAMAHSPLPWALSAGLNQPLASTIA